MAAPAAASICVIKRITVWFYFYKIKHMCVLHPGNFVFGFQLHKTRALIAGYYLESSLR